MRFMGSHYPEPAAPGPQHAALHGRKVTLLVGANPT